MSPRLFPLFAAWALALVACAVKPGQEGNAGAPYRDATWAESRLSYDGDHALLKSVKVSNSAGRHVEAIELDGGVLFFEQRTFGSFTETNMDPDYVVPWLDRNYRIVENGFNFSAADVEEHQNRHGRLVFALLSKPDAHCFVFRQSATSRPPFDGHDYDIILSGHLCRPSTMDSRQVFRLAQAFISHLVFDGGKLNRSTAIAKAGPDDAAAATAAAVAYPVALAVAWGDDQLLVGSGELEPDGRLAPFVLRRPEGGVCRGHSDAPDTWSVTCEDGRNVDGGFRRTGSGRGAGQGRDSAGRSVRLVFGP